MNVVMTGKGPKPRAVLEDLIKAKGDTVLSSVSGKTDILICADPDANTTKLQKARSLGVKIVSYEDYFDL